MSSKSHQIEVSVSTYYIAEHSSQIENKYYFTYHIEIINTGDIAAKLLSRHWFIVDGTGLVKEVQGLGVVGEQPYLEPGGRFQYTSNVTIPTPVGSMYGAYEMLADDGTPFLAEIKAFRLAVPGAFH